MFNDFNLKKGILTTKFAINKAIKEIAPRFKDRSFHFSRVVFTGENRGGDRTEMAYIEYINNEFEKYEKTKRQQEIETGVLPDFPALQQRSFKQERDNF
jgi:hypothetical protein